MTPFLHQVAKHYDSTGDFGDKVFVLPNRRSATYFKKHLISLSDRDAIILPRVLTLSEFVQTAADSLPADELVLLVTLHECWCRQYGTDEELDAFIGWGKILLDDFDAIDASLADPKRLFANAADLERIGESDAWCDEGQKEAVRKLRGMLSGGGAKEHRFSSMWDGMLSLYGMFRDALRAKGQAYGGMIQRDLYERFCAGECGSILEEAFPGAVTFVFVGLSDISPCEKGIMKMMKSRGIAEFCWDNCGPADDDSSNDASRLAASLREEFSPAFGISDDIFRPEVKVVSVPSASGQAMLVRDMLKEAGISDSNQSDYAVILPDTTLLGPVLEDICRSVEGEAALEANVTMGYPVKSSPFQSFLSSVMELQMHMSSNQEGQWRFHYRQVWDLLSDPLLMRLAGLGAAETADRIHKEVKPYVPVEDLSGNALFEEIFVPVLTGKDKSFTDAFADYLLSVIEKMAALMTDEGDSLHMDCARISHSTIKHLKDRGLGITPVTFGRLALEMAGMKSIPYDDDGTDGVQVMGPLETRALDFKHIVILSAQEGSFPPSGSGASMIPSELRNAFGLPTFRRNDAIWAYNFYRLLGRAESVTMLYDSRTEGLAKGEESRYVKQLRHIYRDKCSFTDAASVPVLQPGTIVDPIPKSTEDIQKIRSLRFSASTLQKYIACPVQFYYYAVKGLYKPDEVKDTLDASMLGTVCHDTLEAIYCSEAELRDNADFDKRESDWNKKPHMDFITEEYLSRWLSPENIHVVQEKIDSLIRHKTGCEVLEGENLIDSRLALKFVSAVMERDMEIIRKNGRPIRILGLELPCKAVINGFDFKGFIDRLDDIGDGFRRVVDYKTGSDNPRILDMSEDPSATAGKIFKESCHHEYKAALQYYVYDRMVDSEDGVRTENSMYAMNDIFLHPVKAYPESAAFDDAVSDNLDELFTRMTDPAVPFTRTADMNTCKYCDYCMYCGKNTQD